MTVSAIFDVVDVTEMGGNRRKVVFQVLRPRADDGIAAGDHLAPDDAPSLPSTLIMTEVAATSRFAAGQMVRASFEFIEPLPEQEAP